MGPLTNPIPPQIPGLESFAGTCFHSARWDHDHDLTGKRVAVIGTGSSAAQFVPEIAPHVERLLVFQRTPAWLLPRMNRRITDAGALGVPALPGRAARGARQADGQARAARPAAPDAAAGEVHRADLPHAPAAAGQGPRPAREAHAELPRRLQAADHRRRLVPGAHAPERRRRHRRDHGGAAGGRRHRRRHRPRRRHADPRDGLRDHARGRPAARPRRRLAGRALGASTARPTSARRSPATRTTSCSSGPTRRRATPRSCSTPRRRSSTCCSACGTSSSNGARSIEVREETQHAFSEAIREKLQGTVWLLGGCDSWYLNERGGTSVLWPATTWEFTAGLRRLDPADYELDWAPSTASAGHHRWRCGDDAARQARWRRPTRRRCAPGTPSSTSAGSRTARCSSARSTRSPRMSSHASRRRRAAAASTSAADSARRPSACAARRPGRARARHRLLTALHQGRPPGGRRRRHRRTSRSRPPTRRRRPGTPSTTTPSRAWGRSSSPRPCRRCA